MSERIKDIVRVIDTYSINRDSRHKSNNKYRIIMTNGKINYSWEYNFNSNNKNRSELLFADKDKEFEITATLQRASDIDCLNGENQNISIQIKRVKVIREI